MMKNNMNIALVEKIPACHPQNYEIFLKFADFLKRPVIKEKITPQHPWVCFSNEFGVSDLPAAGGLGYLAGDWVHLSARLGIPFMGVGLYYKTRWRQDLDRNFYQIEHIHHSPHPSHFQFTKLKTDKKHYLIYTYRSHPFATPIEIFTKDIKGNLLIMLYEPGIRGLYEGEKEDEHRLYQSAVLGFAGIHALVSLGITPSILHLNESSTVIAALALLDYYCNQGSSLEQALKMVREITVFTNHTLSPVAEPFWRLDQIKNYIGTNLRCPDVKAWLCDFISKQKTGVCFFDLAFLLAGRVNAVSKIHALKAGQAFGRNFYSITNAVSFRWIYPDILDKYKRKNILHPLFGTLESGYKNKIRTLNLQTMLSIRKKAKRSLRKILKKEWFNQYGQNVIIPPGARIAVWARRFDDYKRPFLVFTDTDRLGQILEKYNIYFLMSGRAHPRDKIMKKKMAEILTKINENPVLKKRVFFVKNYGWRLAKPLVTGADIWINTPRVGMEACGTSWEKAVLNWVLLSSTPDGGAADIFLDGRYKIDNPPFFLIEGENDDSLAAQSLYKNMERMGEVLDDKKAWYKAVLRQLETFLPIANGPGMMSEYLKLGTNNFGQ